MYSNPKTNLAYKITDFSAARSSKSAALSEGVLSQFQQEIEQLVQLHKFSDRPEFFPLFFACILFLIVLR